MEVDKMKKIMSLFMVLMMLVPAAFAAEPFVELKMYDSYEDLSDGQYDGQDIVVIEPTQEEVVAQCMCPCPCPQPPTPPKPVVPQIDVVFLIDSTGSMSDEIRTIKTHIINIVNEVRSGNPSPDLRIGIVAYRDYKPEEREYVFQQYDLTRDIDGALDNLRAIEANGGGDHPEAVETGLHVAINKMNWNSNAKKIVFLIGDAAPHGYGAGDRSFPQGSPEGYSYKDEIAYARAKDITIYTVSCSGMDPAGERIWGDIAKMTGGSYNQLSYQRRVVEEYYEEQGIDEKWIPEAKASEDYDAATGTILTNTLGEVAQKAMVAEAESIGVSYSDKPTTSDSEGNDSWLDSSDITGRAVTETRVVAAEAGSGFFRNVFKKIAFWT
jgi:Mg-chelatase subunit ChlD